MFSWLANLPVARKLMIGFGLLCLMSVLIFGAGWHAIDSLSYRMDRMSAVNRLMDDFSKLRQERSAFVESEGGGQAANDLKEKIRQVAGNLDALRDFFTQEQNRQRIEEMARHLAAYQANIGELEKAYRQIEEARATRRLSGDQALKGLDQLNAFLEGEGYSSERRLELYKAIKDVQMQFLYARFETRAYTYGANPKQYSAATGAIDAALASLAPVREVLGNTDTTLFNELERAMRTYRQSLDSHQSALAQASAVTKQVQNDGDALVRVSQELYEHQMQLREEDTRAAAWTLTSGLVLALVFGVLGALLITRQIVPPLRSALHNVQRIASGDLSHQALVQRTDEIGQLQTALQRMTDSLRGLIGHIGEGASRIGSATGELAAITRQTAASANEQKLETEQVATAMHEMTTSIQDVARNAVETARSVDQAAEEAASGAQVVAGAVVQIESLAREVELTGEAVGSLARESSRIGGMLDVIKAVAEQTNLLALNAAIEAARAGEAGRGFAVVADEVRGLAQRTQQSTEDIEVLIAALQQGTQQAVQRMEASRDLTGASVRLARDAGQALGRITTRMSGIQGMTQQIATAAEQQGAVAEEINRSVLSVRNIADQAHAASGQVSAASVEMAGLGEVLNDQVQRFRL